MAQFQETIRICVLAFGDLVNCLLGHVSEKNGKHHHAPALAFCQAQSCQRRFLKWPSLTSWRGDLDLDSSTA
ncbi:hypothetical protein [Arthrobacter cavernae]|uniref:Uncharacterized protein n=1 Tax=Arthrobacter cavernae TaxID=2817681 RepID=A0A939KMV4_9MICC|nr:hypothetical protein [Arthrobacter cavernae]MBO1268693.1 hypothetical protein [Arthrobacter cavernae]